jgi:CMP-N-acetylneuraminic acid synthetase
MNKIAVIPVRSGSKRLPKKIINPSTLEPWLKLQETNV